MRPSAAPVLPPCAGKWLIRRAVEHFEDEGEAGEPDERDGH